MWVEVTLITPVKGPPQNGVVTVEREVKTRIMADKQSVVRSEYYQNHKEGRQPTAAFRLWTEEYRAAHVRVDKGDRVVEYEPTILVSEGIRYHIGRAHSPDGSDKTELTCSKIM